jgi:hypothetical protein
MTRRPATVAACALGLVLTLAPGATWAVSPTPGVLGLADTRTADVPSSIGGPIEVLVAVILLGVATALVTTTIVRLARPRSRP